MLSTQNKGNQLLCIYTKQREIVKVTFSSFFIVVEKQPPFSVAVYVADEEMVTLGYEKARRGLSKIKYWEDAKEFPNYSETVEIIGLPDWAKGRKNSTNLSPMDIELY